MLYRRTKRENRFLLLFMIIVGLGIGYAFLQSDLSITGIGNFYNTKMHVYFDNITNNPNSISLSSNDVSATISPTTNTDITFTVTLQNPGDFYEFTVDVINDGIIDVMVGEISTSLNGNPISDRNVVPSYARFLITYTDGIYVAKNHLLSVNQTQTYKVRVEYRTDIDLEDIPTSEQTLTFGFGVQYVQADSHAVAKPSSSFEMDSWDTIIANVKAGTIPSYYTVGSTKAVELGNGLGAHVLRIANMSTPSECSTEGFSQTACGFVLEFADIVEMKEMISYDYLYNVYGWWRNDLPYPYYRESEMRLHLNDENDSTSIINSLPKLLRDAIINTVVVSTNYVSNEWSNVTTTDKLYLLSSKEVYEKNAANVVDDQIDAFTRQLDYYHAQGVTTIDYSPTIKRYNSSNYYWILRSQVRFSGGDYNVVTSNGYCDEFRFWIAGGISPAFRIA